MAYAIQTISGSSRFLEHGATVLGGATGDGGVVSVVAYFCTGTTTTVLPVLPVRPVSPLAPS